MAEQTDPELQKQLMLRQGAPTTPDPFASIGGGVYANGGWTPAGMNTPRTGGQAGSDAAARDTLAMTGQADSANVYAMQQQAPAAAAPAATPDPNDPFASIGGGVQTANGGWVPKGHPLAAQAAGGAAVPAAGQAGYVPPNAAPGTPGTSNIDTQNTNAQTYSQTPGAAPSNSTTNQGTQDTIRNTYLQQIQKGTSVDTNDPNFRQQADAYGAAQERARRNALDDSAQANFQGGTRGSGAENIERRMADETSARNQGQFEAQLVGQELTSRRDEIKNALSSLGGMVSQDQQAALNRELAALDAAIKREGLAQTGSLGAQDISLRDKLGTGALNVDMIRALLQNQQAGNQLGLDYGNSEFNNAYKLMFGGG